MNLCFREKSIGSLETHVLMPACRLRRCLGGPRRYRHRDGVGNPESAPLAERPRARLAENRFAVGVAVMLGAALSLTSRLPGAVKTRSDELPGARVDIRGDVLFLFPRF